MYITYFFLKLNAPLWSKFSKLKKIKILFFNAMVSFQIREKSLIDLRWNSYLRTLQADFHNIMYSKNSSLTEILYI